MHLIAGMAEVVVPLQRHVVGVQHRDVPDQQLGSRRVERQPVIGVGEIGAGGEQHCHGVPCLAGNRRYEERDVLRRARPA